MTHGMHDEIYIFPPPCFLVVPLANCKLMMSFLEKRLIGVKKKSKTHQFLIYSVLKGL